MLAAAHHGHHAGTDMCGGYCYINNAAVAQTLSARGNVAILNMTSITATAPTDFLWARRRDNLDSWSSRRMLPLLPGFADEQGEGAGLGTNHNYPLAFGCDNMQYLAVVDAALQQIRDFGAQTLVISAGLIPLRVIVGSTNLSSGAVIPQLESAFALALPVAVIARRGICDCRTW
jgi:hypothetical protein